MGVGMAKEMIDPQSIVADYFDYVEQYRIASSHLPETGDLFWPRMQLRGLLIELALKTYIAVSGKIIEGHDLEYLAHQAERRGLKLTDEDRDVRIRKTNKLYYEHKGWNSKYLCRYPTPNRGLAAWITPTLRSLDEMIERIIEQARAKRSN